MVTLTVAEVAERLGAEYEGNSAAEITGIADIRAAQPGDLSFVSNMRYASAAEGTQATALVVPCDWNRPCTSALIRIDNPDSAFAEIAAWFAPPPVELPPGIHPAAVIAADSYLAEDVSVGPGTVVEPGVSIGRGSVIAAQCYIGHGCRLGEGCRFYPHVSLRENCRLGSRVTIHNGSVIGSDGFGYTVDNRGIRHKIPQIGHVEIGDDVEIGANVTIDRARFGKTVVGKRVKIDNLVQIAHNVIIGDDAVIVAQVGVSGSSLVGERVILAGQSGVAGHVEIGAGAIVAARAGVTKSIPPRVFVSGFPAAPHEKATRIHAHMMRLPDLKKKVQELERRIAELENNRRP